MYYQFLLFPMNHTLGIFRFCEALLGYQDNVYVRHFKSLDEGETTQYKFTIETSQLMDVAVFQKVHVNRSGFLYLITTMSYFSAVNGSVCLFLTFYSICNKQIHNILWKKKVERMSLD